MRKSVESEVWRKPVPSTKVSGLADVARSGGFGDLTATGKVYIKDAAGTPHYWQLTISTLGLLTTTDVGTTAPTDGVIIIP